MQSNEKKFTKQQLVLLCRLAQQTERYEEMIGYIDLLYKSQGELTSAERSLCSAGYKSVVGNRRAELRVIGALQAKEENKQTNKNMPSCLQKYRQAVQAQLTGFCRRVLKMLDDYLLPNVKSIEAKVFYLKMRGDYCRYLCQLSGTSGENQQYFEAARASYEDADNFARNNLASTNPIRLGLHLNVSVFYYQILNKQQRAIQLANRAFEDAIANIDNVNEENYKDCTNIMQLLRDNITLWGSETQQEGY